MTNQIVRFMSFFSALILFAIPSFAEEPGVIPLSLGEQTEIPVASGVRYSVGNPQVLSVKTTQLAEGKVHLLVRGKSQGYSDLLILGPNGSEKKVFRVVNKKQGTALKDLQFSLSQVPGLVLMPHGDKWVAEGKVHSLKDFNLLQTYIANSNGKVVDRSQLDPFVRFGAEEQLRKMLGSAGLSHLEVKGVSSQIWLEGAVGSKEEKEVAESLAKEVFASAKSSVRVAFEAREILRFKVQILEMVKTENSNQGFEWGNSIPGIVQLHQKILKGQFSLEATLQLLEQKGLVKVLSKPEISLNAEGTAELKVGGEIPIVLKSAHFANVQWKPYGLSLRLETPGVANNLARTNVTVEISTLDHANAIDGLPATKLNHMQTVVDLSLGKTIFLSGLMQNSTGENIQSLPLLGDIPVLGALFRSKNYQQQKSELVMAISAIKDGAHAKDL